MDSFIREISQTYLGKLDNGKNHYHIDDLRKAGLPEVVCKQVEYEIFQIILRELPGHLSEWIQVDSPAFPDALQTFLHTIQTELQLPAERNHEIIEASVDRALKLIVQPLKTIPAFLFDDKEVLSKKEVKQKSEFIFAHRHLTFALLRYMEKKNRNEIDREQAANVLRLIDERLVKDYNPLNWMSLLQPLFDIAGATVHSQLFRHFFEEKGLAKTSATFDQLNSSLSETEFIEVVSSADLLNVDGYTETQHSLFESRTSESVENKDQENSHSERDENDQEIMVPSPEAGETDDYFRDDDERTDGELADIEQDEEPVLSKPDIGEKEKQGNIMELFLAVPDEGYLDVGRLDDDSDQTKIEEVTDETEEVEFQSKEPLPEEPAPWEDIVDEADKEDDRIQESNPSSLETKEDNEPVKSQEPFPDAEEDGDSWWTESEADREEQDIRWTETERDQEDESEGLHEDDSLAGKFIFDDPEDEDEDNEPLLSRLQREPATIYDELNLIQEDPESHDSDEEFETEDEDSENKDAENRDVAGLVGSDEDSSSQPSSSLDSMEKEDEEKEEDVPMWKSFLERDNPNDDEPAFYFDDEADSEPPVNANIFGNINEEEEKPDMNKQEGQHLEGMVDKLSSWLNDEKDRYIFGIFGGSEMAYEQALEDLMIFDTWKNASKYLEKEIFTKNRVDVYDEVAVDFTDKLHTYFMELK